VIEIMGGDLSLTATGLCLPDGSMATLKTGPSSRGDARLPDLGRAFRHQLRAWPVALMVLELPGRFKSADAALGVGMAHGIVREILAEFRVPVAFIAPAVLKMFATGKGNADKAEMVIAANQARNADGTGQEITDHNQADAWWLRQMGLWKYGARHLDEIGATDFDGHGIRHKAVFGPWRKDGGAKWPARLRDAASRS